MVFSGLYVAVEKYMDISYGQLVEEWDCNATATTTERGDGAVHTHMGSRPTNGAGTARSVPAVSAWLWGSAPG
jgi:hypothetical protein